MKKYLSWKLIAVLVVTLILGFFDLPAATQQSIIPFAPDSFTNTKMHLGLDLQGGSQLDYKIDLRKVPEADQEDIINGVLEVIERRVNALGVAEPNIYTSEIAGEYHIVVELAETATISQEDVDTYLGKEKTVSELTDDEKKLVSLEKAKATVGKTILLEFKEEKGEIDLQEKDEIKTDAQTALNRIKEGEDFTVVGQEEMQAFPGKVSYDTSEYIYKGDLLSTFGDKLQTMSVGDYYKDLVEVGGQFTIDESGNAVEATGLAILKLADTAEEIKDEKSVEVSHILLSYKDATSADASITRSEEDAYLLAKDLMTQLEEGADFATLAQEYSNDPSNKDAGGRLDAPVTGNGTYEFDFEDAALALENAGDLSKITKTQFGYHVIKANKIATDVTETQYKYETITYSLVPDPWKDAGLTGKHFVRADVQLDNFYQPYVSIQFDDEGADLFEEITKRNVGKKLAIFVGGDLISAPTVNDAIAGGSAIITGQFTTDEAKELARDLNTGAIPAPIVLTGEYTIGATLGHEALSKSLMAGAIGLILILLFMPFYYRVPGLLADASLIVYAAIFLFLLKSQLPLGVALAAAVVIFGFLIVRIVNNKDSGWEKLVSFVLACAGFFFLTFLLKTGVVMTLAGVAGIILSIGMAVDANILIFERFKEELKTGKTYTQAVQVGFEKAWSAIRDSNFSTLLICAILFTFGSSIIKGFAFTLAAGILVSMFTAITITRLLMNSMAGKKLTQEPKKLGIREKKATNFQFIQKSKIWMTISGILIAISLFSTIAFGLNLGLDFTGGTLMEFKFTEEVTKDTLEGSLNEIAEELTNKSTPVEDKANETSESSEITESSTTALTAQLNEDQELGEIDLSGMKVIPSGDNNFVVKTKYLTSSNHDLLVTMMEERLPEFTEPRFTTIGPTIGATILSSAIKAIIFAIIIIVFYVAFAFRKIPKEISPWRFGACAIAALLHDVIIITGLFVILGQFFNVEIDALFVTALLTVFGYSVNDTIVIFDRIRDNLIKQEPGEKLEDIANKSLNQTFTRSMNTSLSTLFTLVAVLFLGSPSIFYFVLALTAGTIIGTYSSIFTATPLLVMWSKKYPKKVKMD